MRFEAGSGWESDRWKNKSLTIVSGTSRPMSITSDPDVAVSFIDDSGVELLDGDLTLGSDGDGSGSDVGE